MRSTLRAALGGIAGVMIAVGGASWLIVALVTAAGVRFDAAPCAELEPDAGLARAWLDSVARLRPGGEGWSCRPIDETLERALESVTLAGVVLGLSTLIAAVLLWREGGWQEREEEPPGTWSTAWLMAPPVLWAALITAGVNALGVMMLSGRSGIDPAWYQFPLAPEPMRRAAAVLALMLGGGTLWSIRSGLRTELEELRRQDFILLARANGWDVRGRLLRNLAAPTAARLVGRLPLLLGEVVVVEYVFALDGAGRELLALLERRDGPALTAVTVCLVGVTMGMRAATGMLEAWLHPALREEVA